jgi:hypothetical protein
LDNGLIRLAIPGKEVVVLVCVCWGMFRERTKTNTHPKVLFILVEAGQIAKCLKEGTRTGGDRSWLLYL